MKRFEPTLFTFLCACWIAAVLHHLGLVPLAGTLAIQPQALFIVAAATGWLSGNIYVHRRRSVPQSFRRRLLLLYMILPAGLFFLLWALAPAAWQAAAPLTAILAFGVSSVLFLVPYLLRRWPPRADG